METLRFTGNVVNGIGRHNELVVPGRNAFPEAPVDWPALLFPGSLNLRVLTYPAAFLERGIVASTSSLDVMGFEPEFTIPQDLMGNNQLTPTETMPYRGTAQIWRASLETEARMISCWVLRRIGSGLRDQIELVSSIGLRGEMGLTREKVWPASVDIFGDWKK